MHQRRQHRQQIQPIGTNFYRQCALCGCGQHHIRLQALANALFQPQAFQPSGGQHNAIDLAFVQLAQAGIHIAAQRYRAHIGPQGAQLRRTPQTGGAHRAADRHIVQAGVLGRYPGIARVFTFQHAGQPETVRQLHGHVFERMHGDVGPPILQGIFDFLDEQALAADLTQRLIQHAIALGRQPQYLYLLVPQAQQHSPHMVRLPQSQTALPGGNHKREGGGRKVLGHGKAVCMATRVLMLARSGSQVPCQPAPLDRKPAF